VLHLLLASRVRLRQRHLAEKVSTDAQYDSRTETRLQESGRAEEGQTEVHSEGGGDAEGRQERPEEVRIDADLAGVHR
jgi:hypothetical protein